MSEITNSNQSFKIGICMAGAVSAGAYTAGVMDYLMEALENWELHKKNKDTGTPTHQVEIPVLGGASAGGMTAIITSSIINNLITPTTEVKDNLLETRPESKLYHSWVDLINDEMIPLLLNNSDITENNKIFSLLNSNFIEEVANSALIVDKKNWVYKPYFSKNVKVFTTLTNLEGFDYEVKFISNANNVANYFVERHSDYACFNINNSIDLPTNEKGWMNLDFKTDENIEIAKQTAMATGAFPVGLRSRKLVRKASHVNEMKWGQDIFTVKPKEPNDGENYVSLNVDGGVINNEPFEKVKEVLMDITKETFDDNAEYNTFKSTVLMIDPFPSEKAKFDFSDEITNIIGGTLAAMLGQVRYKPTSLVNAIDPKFAGQFLIAPSREFKLNNETEKVEGSKAIACGSLAGFGGFISKEFRIHDYYLGRANCEIFLRDYFTIPADTTNPIFVNGYKGIDKSKFLSKKDGSLQIIPIFTERKDNLYFPKYSNNSDWPTISEYKIDNYRALLKQRINTVLLNLTKYSKTEKVLLKIGAWVFINGKVANIVIKSLKKSLKAHKLIK
jgi:predicted acylesterase/phospholipase RssA